MTRTSTARPSMALRTRVFGLVLKRLSTAVEDVAPADFPAFRAKRVALQNSRAGRFVFGAAAGGVAIEDRLIELDGADIRFRIYRPALPGAIALPVVVNFHGGGWVQGNPEQSEWAASRIAARVGAVVISVAYRLAPEAAFPAGVSDCWAAVQWVHQHAGALGVDPDKIAVMGDSAGGNLAAVVSLMARDAGAPTISRQILIYPGVEMYDRWPSEDRHAEAPVLTSRNMRAYAKIYLGDSYGTEDFRASPIRAASHAGVAPALIQTAEFDPLLDNGARYRDVLRAAGVQVDYSEYAGAIHGYLSLPGVVPAAARALDEIVKTLTGDFKPL